MLPLMLTVDTIEHVGWKDKSSTEMTIRRRSRSPQEVDVMLAIAR
jgi:hypothetical protein